MRINSETVLEGEKIVLVPYRKEHVPRYVCSIEEFELHFTLVYSI